jgi:DNA invertase Pin-like site-specific DNA recombinase
MNVALYARVSSAKHDQRPEAQIDALKRYVGQRGWTTVQVIADHGYSGSTDARPGLNKLMALARSRQIDGIAVTKMDRLFRSLKHLVTTLEELSALGVLFVAVHDNVDYSTPSGRLFVQILGSLAEFERSLIRERTIAGLEYVRSKGVRLGRPCQTDYDEILRRLGSGETQSQVRRALGVSKGAIWRAMRMAPRNPSQPHTQKLSKFKQPRRPK